MNRTAPRTWIAFGLVTSSWVAAVSCSDSPTTFDFPTTGGRAAAASGQGGQSTSSGTGGGISTGKGGSGITIPPPMDAGPDACKPLSCMPTGGQYCGQVGDGCGSKMECGACPVDWTCDNGLCKGGASCPVRTSCTEGAATYCGKIGNNCGGEVACPECPAPSTCGGSGIPNVCGDPACVPISCQLANGAGQYCGQVGNGCGGALDCGECANGKVCGAEGIPGVCPGSAIFGCTGIKCNVEKCAPGGPSESTKISGTVYDPAGVNPLYNVRVYIPNGPLDPIPTGAKCEQCSANLSGQPITLALTDAAGRFTLENVPTGANIPLVMQVGRWRRQVTIPNVVGCTDNVISDPQLLRLPRNQQEGDIPLIAITTGSADALECIIPRIGLDRSEVTTDSGTGRVHLYAGGIQGEDSQGATSMTPGGTLPHASTLWSNEPKMRGYDIVMFSCEGAEDEPPKDPYLANLETYVNNGGRAFLTHFHYYWLNHGSSAFQGTAVYSPGGENPPRTVTGIINTSFPKGAALADWLVNVGASPTRGQLQISDARASVRTAIPPTQDWISVPMNPADNNMPALQYMTFNTPVGAPAEQQCGRVVDTDLHIGAAVGTGNAAQGGDTSDADTPYPNGCQNTPMSPQIKALEFIFFDLAACVQPDFETPVPPNPPPTVGVPPPPAPVPPPPPPPPPL